MSDTFDPYYIWLGIPPEDQPPHHYRLLGVTLFEANREVIEAAANRQMAYMQEISAGDEHIDQAQKILGELSKARVCLLNQEKKKAYDDELRDSFDSLAPAPEPANASKPESAPSEATNPLMPPTDGQPNDRLEQSSKVSVGLQKHRPKGTTRNKQSTLYLALAGCFVALAIAFFIYRINASPSNPSEVTQPGHSKQPRLSKQTFLSQQHWQEDGDGRIVVPLHREYQRLLKRFKDPSDLLQESNLADAIRDAYNKAKNDRKQYQNKIPNHLRDEIVFAKIEILPKEIDAYRRLTDEYEEKNGVWWPKRFAEYPEEQLAFHRKIDATISKQSLAEITELAKRIDRQFNELRNYQHKPQNIEAARTLSYKFDVPDDYHPKKAIAWTALQNAELIPEKKIWKSSEHDAFANHQASFIAEMNREHFEQLKQSYEKLRSTEQSRATLKQHTQQLGHALADLPELSDKAQAYQALIEQNIVIEEPHAYAENKARQTYDQLSVAFDENAPDDWPKLIEGLSAAQTAYGNKLESLKKNAKLDQAIRVCGLQWHTLAPDLEQWIKETFFILDEEDKNTITAIKWQDELKETLTKANAVYDYKEKSLQSQLQLKGKQFNSRRKRATALQQARRGMKNLSTVASKSAQFKSQLQKKKPSELGVGRGQRDKKIYELRDQENKANAHKQKVSSVLKKLDADRVTRNAQLQELYNEIEILDKKIKAIKAFDFIKKKEAFRKVLQEKPLELDGMLRKFKKDLANQAKKQS